MEISFSWWQNQPPPPRIVINLRTLLFYSISERELIYNFLTSQRVSKNELIKFYVLASGCHMALLVLQTDERIIERKKFKGI